MPCLWTLTYIDRYDGLNRIPFRAKTSRSGAVALFAQCLMQGSSPCPSSIHSFDQYGDASNVLMKLKSHILYKVGIVKTQGQSPTKVDEHVRKSQMYKY